VPAKSEKQLKFMRAVAHNPKFAKKVDVPQSVGEEFSKKGITMKKRYDDGGEAKGGKVKKMAAGGSFRRAADGVAKKGKTKGKQVRMAKGGCA
jgi:hypothetical protein